jgi:ribosomal protein S11
MRTIIAGSRGITDVKVVFKAIKDSKFTITEVLSGGAKGVDRIAEQYAASKGLPCRVFKADWGRHGQMGGIIRNEEMASHADALIAVWDGQSHGTEHMIREAQRVGLKVYQITIVDATKHDA